MSQSLADLECHFKWNLKDETDRKIKELIENVNEKLEIEPLRKIPYLCLLSYLYACKRDQSYSKAYECLDQADKLNANIASRLLPSDFIECQFVVEANRLNIDAIRSERTTDHHERIVRLHNMWNNADLNARNTVRASVLLVKSFSCLRFGPLKYQMGADVAEEVIALRPDSLHGHYIRALLLARIRRLQDLKSIPDEYESRLWNEAWTLAEQNYEDNRRNDSRVQLCAVLVHYAESIVGDKTKDELTDVLAERGHVLLTEIADDSIVEKNLRLVIKFAKVYRLKNKKDKLREMLNLLRPLVDRTRKAQVLFELAKEVRMIDVREYEQLLQKGQEIAEAPGHIWIDLALLKFRCSQKCPDRLSKDEAIIRYDDLIKKYEKNQMNKAVVMVNKGFYCTLIQRTEAGIKLMTKAVKLSDSCVCTSISKWQRENMLADMQKKPQYRDEWIAWYLDNIIKNQEQESVTEALYIAALSNSPNDKFSLKHFAKNRIRTGNFKHAEELVRRLNDSCKSKRSLLSQALIGQVNVNQVTEAGIRILTECLSLGCKDACHIAVCLLQHVEQDEVSLTQCIIQAAQNGTAPILTPFSRTLYELCAHIDHALDSHEAFFINQDLDDEFNPMKIRNAVRHFLRIGTPESSDIRRGNAMRENRLASAKQFIKDQDFQTAELNESIVASLKEARETLDRSFQEFLDRIKKPQSVPYYPFGFSFAKQKQQKKSQSTDTNDEKLQELKNQIDAIMSVLPDEHELRIKFEKKLPNVLVDALKKLLAQRESWIFINQGPWLAVWQFMVNLEKHTRRIDVVEFNRMLQEYNCRTGDGGSVIDVYKMMHLAAEFAEYTVYLLSEENV